VSPGARIYTLVALSAAGAAGIVVAITAVTANHPEKPLGPRAGKTPFAADWTASRALAREVRAAVGSVSRLRTLADEHPSSSFVRLNLGLALFWQRDDAGAVQAWKQAKRLQRDTPSSIHAGDLLHPDTPPGLPKYVPGFNRPQTNVQRLLVRGLRLQKIGRPVSAEREFAHAAAIAPDDPEAQVAAAVGLYDKDRPAVAFARLGPLVRRFPHAQTVRFHLGLLSIWLRHFTDARKQLRLVVAEGRKTRYTAEARLLLNSLESIGNK
jgi:tetratricopeptide (TPR) repeat protein